MTRADVSQLKSRQTQPTNQLPSTSYSIIGCSRPSISPLHQSLAVVPASPSPTKSTSRYGRATYHCGWQTNASRAGHYSSASSSVAVPSGPYMHTHNGGGTAGAAVAVLLMRQTALQLLALLHRGRKTALEEETPVYTMTRGRATVYQSSFR